MLQDNRNWVFHEFHNGACRNLVCTGLYWCFPTLLVFLEFSSLILSICLAFINCHLWRFLYKSIMALFLSLASRLFIYKSVMVLFLQICLPEELISRLFMWSLILTPLRHLRHIYTGCFLYLFFSRSWLFYNLPEFKIICVVIFLGWPFWEIWTPWFGSELDHLQRLFQLVSLH